MNIFYRVNVVKEHTAEYQAMGKLPKHLKQTDDRVRVISDRKLTYVRIPHTYFSDKRVMHYYFGTIPGIPLYKLYELYRQKFENQCPDPLFGGSLIKHDKDYALLKKEFEETYAILKIASVGLLYLSYTKGEVILINPITLRAIHEIERTAYERYGLKFSYFGGEKEHASKEYDIVFVPVSEHVDYAMYIFERFQVIVDMINDLYVHNGDAKSTFLADTLIKSVENVPADTWIKMWTMSKNTTTKKVSVGAQ